MQQQQEARALSPELECGRSPMSDTDELAAFFPTQHEKGGRGG